MFPLDSVPIYNAAGAYCTSYTELQELNNSESDIILTKSCTLKYRYGNLGKRYWENESITINSTGLANLGYQKYLDFENKTKPYYLSVAGLSLADNITIIKQATNVDAIELNLSCPNLTGKTEVAYDLGELEVYLTTIFREVTVPLGLKLPAYPNNYFWDCASDIINSYPVSFVTCINSIGHCFVIDPETDGPVIAPNSGHGGMGGDYIKPIALANAKKMRKRLSNKIDVVGCGGIKTGRDVYDYVLCGASAVQVGSALVKEGPSIFSRLKTEFENVMVKKGYSEIAQFKGKLIN